MRKKYEIKWLFALFILLVVMSCNKNDSKQYRVAMLAEGHTYDDLSFLQSCKQGMENAKQDFKLEVEYNIDTDTENFQQRIDSYGEQNFDLIIAIGYMWDNAVLSASKKYANTKFIIVDTELSEPQSNVVSILFDVDEAAFPLGYLAAWWADTNDSDPKLGVVGALEIPQIRQFVEPFNNGALRYNAQYGKSVEILSCYAGDFFNEDLGKHLADSLIMLGADVIFGVGSETGNGSLLKAKEKGKPCVGVDVDQYYSFPEVSDVILSSAMKGLDNAIYEVVKSFVDGAFKDGVYNGKLANDGVKIAPYHNYENLIPDNIKTEIENIKAGIVDGSISTGW